MKWYTLIQKINNPLQGILKQMSNQPIHSFRLESLWGPEQSSVYGRPWWSGGLLSHAWSCNFLLQIINGRHLWVGIGYWIEGNAEVSGWGGSGGPFGGNMMMSTSGNVECSLYQCELSQPPMERGECSLGHCLSLRVQQGQNWGRCLCS